MLLKIFYTKNTIDMVSKNIFGIIITTVIVFFQSEAQDKFPPFFNRNRPNPSSTRTDEPNRGNGRGPNEGFSPFPGLFDIAFEPTKPTTTTHPWGKAVESNLSCYSCRLDFRKGYESDNQCLGRYGAKLHPHFIVNCGPRDIFCRVERTEVNGMLILLTRDCID
ncbi:hypothetical protein Avbf_11026, partial [Armadillidium vulgare]